MDRVFFYKKLFERTMAVESPVVERVRGPDAACLRDMVLVAILVLFVVGLYLCLKSHFNHWKKKGVMQHAVWGELLLARSLSELTSEVYAKFPNDKVVGGYRLWRPVLFIHDPEFINRILVTDFSYFYPRGLFRNRKVEPLMRNLFFADGDLWKLLRQRMTPAFTSGKLKEMFLLVAESAVQLQQRTLKSAARDQGLDARDLMARYTTDFIGACGFGLNADSPQHERRTFKKICAEMLRFDIADNFMMNLREAFPHKIRNLKYFEKIEKEFTDHVAMTIQKKKFNPHPTNDFISLLLECKRQGTVIGESIENINSNGSPEATLLEIDDEVITAQLFVFVALSLKTLPSTSSFTLNQLAHNLDVQKKAQDEIDYILNKYDNRICYEAIHEMRYLEWTFKESLRMFLPLGFLVRECARKYTFPEINLTVDEGTRVIIPIQAIQHDPRYFEAPDVFMPERFNPALRGASSKFVFLPFGDGPRICIGARLGMLQSMAGLAAILSTFTVRPAPNSVRRPAVDPKGYVVQTLKHGLPLIFEKRTHITTH